MILDNVSVGGTVDHSRDQRPEHRSDAARRRSRPAQQVSVTIVYAAWFGATSGNKR